MLTINLEPLYEAIFIFEKQYHKTYLGVLSTFFTYFFIITYHFRIRNINPNIFTNFNTVPCIETSLIKDNKFDIQGNLSLV